MKKKFALCLCLCLLNCVAFGQTIVVKYEVSFKKDSTNLSNTQREDAYLYIKPNVLTVYATKDFYELDTLFKSIREGRSISQEDLAKPSNSYRTNFPQMIFQSLETQVLTFYEKITLDYYKCVIDEPINWKIDSSETTKINGYECNLASTIYAGRNYIAWFTTEIPISSGPYIFRGLPGLIVKVEDDRKHYSFALQNLTTTDIELQDSPLAINHLILTDYKKMFKIREQMRINPFKVIEARIGGKVSVSAEMMERAKNNVKSNNNPLELSID